MKLQILSVIAAVGYSSRKGYDAEVHFKVGVGNHEPQTQKVVAEGFSDLNEAQRVASEKAAEFVSRIQVLRDEFFNDFRDT